MTRAAIALLFIYLFTSTDGGALSEDSVLNLLSSSINKNSPTIILIKNENSDDSRSKYDIASSSDENDDIIYVNADYDDTVDINVMKKDKLKNDYNRNNNKIQEILKTIDRVMINNQISHENNYHTINEIDNNYIVTNDNFDRLTNLNNDNNAFTYEDYRDSALYDLKNLIYKGNFKDKFRTSNKGSIEDKSKQRPFHVAKSALRHIYGYWGENEEQSCKNSNLKLGMTLRPASYRPQYANDDCKS